MAIRRGDQDTDELLQKSYKPIIDPVQKILTEVEQQRKPQIDVKKKLDSLEPEPSATPKTRTLETDVGPTVSTKSETYDDVVFDESSGPTLNELRSQVFKSVSINRKAYQEYLSNYHELPREYIHKYYLKDDNDPIDSTNGVRLDPTTEK